MNNLKQIGLFAAMYTADNVSHYPTQSKYGGSSWDDKFSAYDGRVLTDAEIAEPALLASALGPGPWPQLPLPVRHRRAKR